MKWNEFTAGWIESTAALINNTPNAFRDGLPKTETWAILAAEQQQQALSSRLRDFYSLDKKSEGKGNVLDDPLHGGAAAGTATNLDENNLFGESSDSKAAGNPDQDNESSDGYDSEVDDEDDNAEGGLGGQGTRKNPASILMDQLHAISKRMRQNDDEDANVSFDDNQDERQNLSSSDTICLWSSANEVIPCICTNRRRNVVAFDAIQLFLDAVDHLKQRSDQNHDAISRSCFFLSTETTQSPLFFAIDCRKVEEKSLGLFPKAYLLDPEVIYDGESLMELLAILKPMATTTHIAIIGSGKDYHKWAIKDKFGNSTRKTRQMRKEIAEAIEEEHKRLNAIAITLIKKSFKYVSILQGGFVEAVKYLNRPESRITISSSLVDVDKFKLNSLLGIHTIDMNQKATLAARIEALSENAPAAIKSVGNIIANWRSSAAQPSKDNSPNEVNTPTSTNSQSSTGTSTTTASAAAAAASAAEAIAPTAAAAKQVLSGFGKTLSMFGAASLDSVKKGIAAYTAPTETTTPAKKPQTDSNETLEDGATIISSDSAQAEPQQKTAAKSDTERAQALALHRLSGLKKGDQIAITRAELPGAVLFPCTKIKETMIPIEESGELLIQAGANNNGGDASSTDNKLVKKEVVVSRYLVISRERFMVLDANGGGIGSMATVKSNHHLTELTKMTFRKKDPESVTIHLLSADGKVKPRNYRVQKYKDFIEALQRHMERFN